MLKYVQYGVGEKGTVLTLADFLWSDPALGFRYMYCTVVTIEIFAFAI